MIRLEIGLKTRHRYGRVMNESVRVIEDKTAVVVVAPYYSVSRIPVRLKDLM